jgi:predicted HAD superfamily phosphohydrolase YqeG
MDISTSNNTDMSTIQVDALQKSLEINQREALKIIESALEESKQVSANKTGIGRHLNISG